MWFAWVPPIALGPAECLAVGLGGAIMALALVLFLDAELGLRVLDLAWCKRPPRTRGMGGAEEAAGAAGAARVLCYGDSLTAGLTGFQFSPWAEHLAAGLRGRGAPGAEVAAVGLSGLTARQLADGADAGALRDAWRITGPGLRRALRGAKPPYRCAVLMAGTNDLGRHPARHIVVSLLRLHRAAHSTGTRTVAVGIPTSNYTAKVPPAAAKRAAVNAALRVFAERSGGAAAYVDPPVPYDASSGLWAGDGLHMSAKGYERHGAALAQPVFDAVFAPSAPACHLPPPAAEGEGGGAAAAGAARAEAVELLRAVGCADSSGTDTDESD